MFRRFGLLAIMSLGLASCMQTPHEKLVGRWFNRDMSIRFRDDGTVTFNSGAGLAVGRYYYNGVEGNASNEIPTRNLTLDLLRNNRHVRIDMVVEFLGQDRLRLLEVRAKNAPAVPSSRQQMVVLKRAANPTKAG